MTATHTPHTNLHVLNTTDEDPGTITFVDPTEDTFSVRWTDGKITIHPADSIHIGGRYDFLYVDRDSGTAGTWNA